MANETGPADPGAGLQEPATPPSPSPARELLDEFCIRPSFMADALESAGTLPAPRPVPPRHSVNPYDPLQPVSDDCSFDADEMIANMREVFGETEKYSLKRISHVHDLVMNWMLLNPQKSLRECSEYFGYTQAWLSTLIHSDIFQARLKEKQELVFAQVAQSIPRKLTAVADVALEKLGEMVADSTDPEFVLDVADKALHRMGFAPASARNPAGSPAQHNNGPVQNNTFIVGASDLADARDMMRKVGLMQDQEQVREKDVTPQAGALGDGA